MAELTRRAGLKDQLLKLVGGNVEKLKAIIQKAATALFQAAQAESQATTASFGKKAAIDELAIRQKFKDKHWVKNVLNKAGFPMMIAGAIGVIVIGLAMTGKVSMNDPMTLAGLILTSLGILGAVTKGANDVESDGGLYVPFDKAEDKEVEKARSRDKWGLPPL
jgi:hypothetical protein